MLAAPPALHGTAFPTFFPSVIGVISFWATLALNIPDYSRYATSQRGQTLGQAFSMPLTMALLLHRHRRHVGDGRHVRESALESDRSHPHVSHSGWW